MKKFFFLKKNMFALGSQLFFAVLVAQ